MARMLHVIYVLPAFTHAIALDRWVDRRSILTERDAQVAHAVSVADPDPDTWGLSPAAQAAEARLLDSLEDEDEAEDQEQP
jgi:hypothetical protein